MTDVKAELSQGSTVQLNSGGPNMTILEVNETAGTVKCGWFDEGAFKEKVLPKLAIKNATATKPSLMILPQDLINKAGLAHAVGTPTNA